MESPFHLLPQISSSLTWRPPNKPFERTRLSVGCFPWRSVRAVQLSRKVARDRVVVMKLMNIRTCCLAILLIVAPSIGSAAEAKKEAAKQAALEWLALVDATQYEASWKQAASLFRTQVSTSDWMKAVAAARSPLGGFVARDLISATYATSLPGAPDGEYVVLQFQTQFENKAQAVETVTPMLDEGQWRVAGYYIR